MTLSNNVKVRNIDIRIYEKENWNKNREGAMKFNQMLKWGSWQKEIRIHGPNKSHFYWVEVGE